MAPPSFTNSAIVIFKKTATTIRHGQYLATLTTYQSIIILVRNIKFVCIFLSSNTKVSTSNTSIQSSWLMLGCTDGLGVSRVKHLTMSDTDTTPTIVITLNCVISQIIISVNVSMSISCPIFVFVSVFHRTS
jgi:hypothetical protein